MRRLFVSVFADGAAVRWRQGGDVRRREVWALQVFCLQIRGLRGGKVCRRSANAPKGGVQDESGHGRVLLSVEEAGGGAHAAAPEPDLGDLACARGGDSRLLSRATRDSLAGEVDTNRRRSSGMARAPVSLRWDMTLRRSSDSRTPSVMYCLQREQERGESGWGKHNKACNGGAISAARSAQQRARWRLRVYTASAVVAVGCAAVGTDRAATGASVSPLRKSRPRQIEAEDGDVEREQHADRIVGVDAAPAVPVQEHDARKRLRAHRRRVGAFKRRMSFCSLAPARAPGCPERVSREAAEGAACALGLQAARPKRAAGGDRSHLGRPNFRSVVRALELVALRADELRNERYMNISKASKRARAARAGGRGSKEEGPEILDASLRACRSVLTKFLLSTRSAGPGSARAGSYCARGGLITRLTRSSHILLPDA